MPDNQRVTKVPHVKKGTRKELSPLQSLVMKILWERGEATVSDVQADLQEDRAIAHNTVATVLTRLVNDGVLSVRREGRTNVYKPVVAETAVKRTMVSNLLGRLFEGNASALVHHLVAEGELEPEELENLAKLVADKKRTKDN